MKKALRLNKETIRAMGDVQLSRVHGGRWTTNTDCKSPPDPPDPTEDCNSAICVTQDCSGNSAVCSLPTHCYCTYVTGC